jgi:hypothetical protein
MTTNNPDPNPPHGRHYLPEQDRIDNLECARMQYLAPRPGTGVVYVRAEDPDTSGAIWQGEEPDEMVDFDGPPEASIEWARAQPAAKHLIFDPGTGDFVPLAPPN